MYYAPEDDFYLIRNETYKMFLITCVILYHFELYWLFGLYCIVSSSGIIGSDEDIGYEYEEITISLIVDQLLDEKLDQDIDLEMEIQEYEFSNKDFELPDILDSVLEDPIFPESYAIVDLFQEKMSPKDYHALKKLQSKMKRRPEYRIKAPLLRSRMVPTFALQREYFSSDFFRKHAIIQFKAFERVTNKFLAQTIIAHGLYPYRSYDYNMYFANQRHLYHIMNEYSLLIPTSLDLDLELSDYFDNDIEKIDFLYDYWKDESTLDGADLELYLAGKIDIQTLFSNKNKPKNLQEFIEKRKKQ